VAERDVAALFAEARARWPDFAVDEAGFADYHARIDAKRAGEGRVHAADLYLACACAAREPRALVAFEAEYFSEIDGVAARLGARSVSADELRQHMREKLFVGSERVAPAIGSYAGRGSLRGWLRVASMRTALNLTRGVRETPLDADLLLETPDAADYPELSYLKELYRVEFKAAFAEALLGLTFRERNLLRYALAEGLSAEQIAAVYGTHKTTVNRWLAQIRESLFTGVRDAMMAKLSVDRTEFESILRLIRSRLDVSLSG
jgi:RNA polymerase sigma-70 factor, ECF subfamily